MISGTVALFISVSMLILYAIVNIPVWFVSFEGALRLQELNCGDLCQKFDDLNQTVYALQFNVLPSAFEQTTVYGGSIYQTTEGMRLRTPEAAYVWRPPGMRHGLGVGPAAFGGLRIGCGAALDDWEGAVVRGSTRRPDPTTPLAVVLLVDNNNSSAWDAGDCVLTADASTVANLEFPLAGSFADAVLNAGDPIWRAAPGGGCAPGPAALSALTAPEATLFCGNVAHPLLPKGTDMAAFQIMLGLPDAHEAHEVTVHAVSFHLHDQVEVFLMNSVVS